MTIALKTTGSYRLGIMMMAAAILPVLTFGCAAPSHQQCVKDRLDSLHQTASVMGKLEAEQPKKIDRPLAWLADQHERDVDNTSRMPAELERLLRQEVFWWEQNLPGHERRFNKMMQGDVDNIESTLPRMLY